MKKSLLLLGAAALCTSAYAQQEAGWVSADNSVVAEAWGWDGANFLKDKVGREAGTLMIETPNVTLRTAFVDDCTISSINKLSLNHYAVNNVLYTSEGAENNIFNGGVGNSNPKAITDLANPVISSGWVLDYEVKADGYMTVFAQFSINKNFYVVEGVMGDGQVSPNGIVAYELYLKGKTEVAGLDGLSYSYILPADEDGYLDLESPELSKYSDGSSLAWPYKVLTGHADWTDDEAKEASGNSYGNWNGATIFPVYEGCHYYVFATGSKLTGGPFVYTKEKPTQVAFVIDGDTPTVLDMVGTYDASAAVNTIAADQLDENAPIYNTQGVRVASDAKGILIQNGRKFVRF